MFACACLGPKPGHKLCPCREREESERLGRKWHPLSGPAPVNVWPSPRGWECPKCGKVYAPFVAECSKCNCPVAAPVATEKGNG